MAAEKTERGTTDTAAGPDVGFHQGWGQCADRLVAPVTKS